MNGVINVFKEQNMTSHDCVAIVRRTTGVKRVGHTGTLDPMATGVLPICIGRTARIMDYTDLDKKEYVATLKLGVETDTLDIWGKILEEKIVEKISEEKILKEVSKFQGEIEQTPPKYSALKVNGKKLYEYAREGKAVEIKTRKVMIHQIQVLGIKMPYITIRVLCGKGTYIRSLCADLAKNLGNIGTMTALERTKSGIFHIENAINIMDIKKMTIEEIDKIILPPDYPLVHFGKINLDENQKKDFLNGKILDKKKVEIIKASEESRYNIYEKENFIGVGFLKGDRITVDKILF